MDVKQYPKFLEIIRSNEKLVYLCGAGFSMALGEHRSSWAGWLQAGKAYLSDKESAEFDRIIGSWSADELIEAAGYLLTALRSSGSYHAFMQGTISVIHPKQEKLIRALRFINRSGDFLATTNYDLSMESATGTGTVTYSAPGDILQILTGQMERKIIHLHGAYDPAHGIDDIIADGQQYRDILENKGAQFIQNLIGTHPLIIVGCGATVEDPNLSGFLTFADRYLGTDIPYFYLHKEGDDLSTLPKHIVPICYGSDYADLPVFMEKLTAYRVRERISMSDIAAVNPYQESPFSASAFARMHYSTRFNTFVGRQEECSRLSRFCDSQDTFSWWAVTGEGGIGKSRLLLEWLRSLPSNWYGFFARINPDAFSDFEPFTDTVIVFDYLMNKEEGCARVISRLIESFEKTGYKLRIVLLERRLEAGSLDWYTRLVGAMDPADRLIWETSTYHEAASCAHAEALHVGPLDLKDELVYIKEYLQAFLPVYAGTGAAAQYLAQVDAVSLQIQKSFREQLVQMCDRPLFLSIFVEVWVAKDGNISVNTPEELLEEYTEKEENRWRERFHGNEEVLYAFLKILAMACGVEIFCVNEYDEGYLEQECECFMKFLNSERRAGKKKISWTDLFLSEAKEEIDRNNAEVVLQNIFESEEIPDNEKMAYASAFVKIIPTEEEQRQKQEKGYVPKTYLLMQPVYPDIIREFLVDYYVDEDEWDAFTKLARGLSTLEFGNFMNRALEDFPEKESFLHMALTMPEEETDLFEAYATWLVSMRHLTNAYDQMAGILQRSATPEYLRSFEVEIWRRMAIVLTEQNDLSALEKNAAQFFDYLKKHADEEEVLLDAVEVIEAYAVAFHNQKRIEQLSEIAEAADEIADLSKGQELFAEECAEIHGHIVKLKELFDGGRKIHKNWSKLSDYFQRFSDNETIADVLSEASVSYVTVLTEQGLTGRIRKVNEKLKEVCSHIKTGEIAGDFALCLSNEYACCQKKIREAAAEEAAALQRTKETCLAELEILFSDYPECREVRMGYGTARVDHYFDLLDAQPEISEEDCARYKKWFEDNRDTIEFAEIYTRALVIRYHYLKHIGHPGDAKKCVREIEKVTKIIDKTPFREEYHEEMDIVLDLIYAGMF